MATHPVDVAHRSPEHWLTPQRNTGPQQAQYPIQEFDPVDGPLALRGFNTNAVGVVRVTEAALPLLRRSNSPVVVTVSSSAGSFWAVTNPGRPEYHLTNAVYAASKAAATMLTVQYAKANPGKLNYGSGGVGNANHVVTEDFAKKAGIKMTHVPFKGGADAMNALLGGSIDELFTGVATAQGQVKSGKLVALAVSSRQPVEFLPGVPTMSQFAPGLDYQSWLGIAAPAGTPPAVVERLNRELHVVLEQPDIRRRLAELGGGSSHAPGVTGEVVYMNSGGCGGALNSWRFSSGHYAVLTASLATVGAIATVTDSNGKCWAVGRVA
mgnify:CR=1 FL=1